MPEINGIDMEGSTESQNAHEKTILSKIGQ